MNFKKKFPKEMLAKYFKEEMAKMTSLASLSVLQVLKFNVENYYRLLDHKLEYSVKKVFNKRIFTIVFISIRIQVGIFSVKQKNNAV